MREKKEMNNLLPVFAGIGPWVPCSFDFDKINELKEGRFRALQSIPFLGIYPPPGLGKSRAAQRTRHQRRLHGR